MIRRSGCLRGVRRWRRQPLQVAVGAVGGVSVAGAAEPDDLDGLADADGIVCLPSVAGEPPAADRVQQLLAAAFGDEWSPAMVRELLEECGVEEEDLGATGCGMTSSNSTARCSGTGRSSGISGMGARMGSRRW